MIRAAVSPMINRLRITAYCVFLIRIKAIPIKPFDIRHRQFGGIHHLIESESQPILHQTNTASNSAF